MKRKEAKKNKKKNSSKPVFVKKDLSEVVLEEIERVSTGVKGFDDLIEGGIPKDSVVLLSGPSGTGKSIFAMNFLIEGAKKQEVGLYITFEQSEKQIVKEMSYFGWPVKKFLEDKTISVVKPELYDFDKLLTFIEDMSSKFKAKRIVIDSTSLIGMYFKDPFKVRKAMVDLEESLKRLGVTSISINEIPEGSSSLSTYGVEDFVADSVIVLYLQKKENVFSRGIAVRKMRTTNHSMKIHPIQIKRPGGIVVYPSEEVFSEF